MNYSLQSENKEAIKSIEDNLSTEVTDEDLANARTDEFGVMYSADGIRLLKANVIEIDSYSIIKGTRIICDSAFEQCRLNSIQIPDSVTKIGDSSFAACELSSVCLPSSVIEIGHYAFGESTISTIILNDGLKRIGESALEKCRKLTSIVVDDKNEHFDSRNNCNAIIRKADNVLIAGCKSTIIPLDVRKIGYDAFAYCNGLTSITIPNGVVEIGENAFFGCI